MSKGSPPHAITAIPNGGRGPIIAAAIGVGMGPLGSEPAAAASPDPNQVSGGSPYQYVFWKGTDANLWTAIRYDAF